MNDAQETGPLDRAAIAIFWGSALVGVLLPPLAMMLAKQRSPAQVLGEFWLSFTGAEPGFALLTALHAAVFIAYGVFALLHLGRSPADDAPLAARRLGGTLGAGLLLVAASLWVGISIFASRSSTAAIGFLLMPFYLAIAAVLGYGIGRALAARLRGERG